ncbi:helix-turn-helix transcriptional regulator [Streptomyces sp. V3I7]|uniref:ArsR/SmtB family transcription factor n=1 Tax=Streptomyces sp. V3I7 TaxID=3042278 RepID=UPI002788D46B|nr:winged helix-turn-helix domain-containing protein [Streptomyces sp. V3I7]MDQ0994530.1 DNA-binding transcriptional ArsR family regulator [Streptomyces sp. V3I7]
MRLHFTPADLRRVTLIAPDALQEVTLSVRRLRARPTSGHGTRHGLEQWHRRTRAGARDRAGILLDLVPQEKFLPDFLFQLADAFDTGVERAVQTPTEQLAADIGELAAHLRPNRRVRELAEGTSGARQGLAADLRRYFDSCLAELWPQVLAGAAADRALRAETLLRGGVDGLLATLGTRWRWEPPVLHIPWPGPHDIEVPLCGRGLVLLPSYFGGPGLMYRTEEPAVLIYPMHAGDPSAGGADALGPLLGRTRATVLAALRHPATTTTVAERVGVSLPSASQHTTVLRNAGLITTTRTGSAVLHALSPLGEALLNGDTGIR